MCSLDALTNNMEEQEYLHMWFAFVEKNNSNSINSLELPVMPSSSHFYYGTNPSEFYKETKIEKMLNDGSTSLQLQ